MEKIYVGSGKKADKFDIVNITICLDNKLKEHIYDYKGKKYINLTVAAKREKDQYNKTHYVAINTYKPEIKTETNDNRLSNVKEGSDDLPF